MFTASRTSLKLRLASGKALPALWLATGALPVVEAAVRAMPGVIVPRKTVGELRKLLDDDEAKIAVSVSETKVRFCLLYTSPSPRDS